VRTENWSLISNEAAVARFEQLEQLYGLKDRATSSPCLVIDGRVVHGYDLIDEELRTHEPPRR